MAKQARPTTQTVDIENLKFKKVSKDDILFWNFKQNNTIICEILGVEKLEYDCYKVTEVRSKKQYYIPMHSKIVEAVDEYGYKGFYKITLDDIVSFDNGKKTYHSYTVEFAAI